ncbi:inner membrane protein YhjD [Rahnella sikkimica]|uniref:Inner membrane protein YhjD n=1 Tax=Rahnella sikkimica TaxID=1805933 RepID=A0A2L1UTU5_9GAMM|nr:inner membrane protein YhjD [Rahnella sikkimica]AVF36365.1 inner membrane protein YhjD [Rahnella sikkimica]
MPIISKQEPVKQEKPAPLINIKTGNSTVDKNIGRFSRGVEYVQSWGWVAHLLRATERFNDRLGSQFGAAITYFSFLSLIPILMVSFAAVGFVLASNPDLLAGLINKIVNNISDPNLANTLKSTVNTAIQQRTAVGLSGLLIALYSGISWMGNLREAIRAQSRDVWERNPQDQEKILRRYIRDFISLTGLVLALIITLSLTSIAGAAQKTIVDALGLGGIEWLRPVMTSITLVISIAANYLLFLWIFWMLPRHKPRKKALLRGTLLAAIGFEVIKFVMTMTLPKLATSPSGAAFGSVIGLMAFFYFFARLTLFVAAWIATAKYKDDPLMPDHAKKGEKAASGNDSEYTPDDLIVPDEIHITAVNSEIETKKQ